MANLMTFDVLLPGAPLAEQPESLRFVQIVRIVLAEHARAMRAAGRAELPRQGLDELRAVYCSDHANARKRSE